MHTYTHNTVMRSASGKKLKLNIIVVELLIFLLFGYITFLLTCGHFEQNATATQDNLFSLKGQRRSTGSLAGRASGETVLSVLITQTPTHAHAKPNGDKVGWRFTTHLTRFFCLPLKKREELMHCRNLIELLHQMDHNRCQNTL